LNKPYQVLSQFTDSEGRKTLADYVTEPGFYAAGRLDYDSEGLLLLTNDGALQNRLSHPKFKLPKTYWVQVEGSVDDNAVKKLVSGVKLKNGMTRRATVKKIPTPNIWPRTPPIRYRANHTTSWLSITLTEGQNRQVRRMTAAVGFPTLRLIRHQIGQWDLETLKPGELRHTKIHLPVQTR